MPDVPMHRLAPIMIHDKGRTGFYWSSQHAGLRWRTAAADYLVTPGSWAHWHQERARESALGLMRKIGVL